MLNYIYASKVLHFLRINVVHFLSGRCSTRRAPFFGQIYLPPIASIVSVPGIFYSASSLRTLLIIRVLIIQDKWPFLLPYIVSHSPPALLKIVLKDNARYIHLWKYPRQMGSIFAIEYFEFRSERVIATFVNGDVDSFHMAILLDTATCLKSLFF